MRTSPRLRRTLVFTSSAGLVSALAMLPSGSAFAVVSGSFVVAGSATSSPTSGNTCTVVAGDDSSSSPIKAVVGGTVQASTNLNATFQSNTDSGDLTTITGHYTGTVHVKKKHGDLSSLTLTGNGSLSIHRAEGNASHCHTTGLIAAEIEPLQFTESHPGWFLAQRDGTAKSQLVELAVSNVADNSGTILDLYQGGPSSSNERAFGKAGTYTSAAIVGAINGGLILKAANRTSASLAFYRGGAAPSGTSGSGKKFVRFPALVSCSSHSARLTFTGKAGRVAGGSFFVNGHKLASVSNPHAGGHVTLHHVSSTADNTITAKLSLKGGGHATATRAFLPCKG